MSYRGQAEDSLQKSLSKSGTRADREAARSQTYALLAVADEVEKLREEME